MALPVVNWTVSASQLDGNLWNVTVSGVIAPEYHIYDVSQDQEGANPTVIIINGGSDAHTVGDLQVLCPVERSADETLGYQIGTISDTALFSQQVMLDSDSADLEVFIEWMACTENACTPLDDTTITVHIGKEENSSNPYHLAGFACGILLGCLLVYLGIRAGKRKK